MSNYKYDHKLISEKLQQLDEALENMRCVMLKKLSDDTEIKANLLKTRDLLQKIKHSLMQQSNN